MVNSLSSAKAFATLLVVIACVLLLFKSQSNYWNVQQFLPVTYYDVILNLEHSTIREQGYIKTFLPINNDRQMVNQFAVKAKQMDLKLRETSEGKEIQLNTRIPKTTERYQIQFRFEGQSINYSIPDIPYQQVLQTASIDSFEFLAPTELIQANHPKIKALAKQLSWNATTLPQILKSYYDYVLDLEYIQSTLLTDALTTLENQSASCNGKARLFVALCRASNIPARLVGGLILENSTKKTSHQWAEIRIAEHWVPFDVTNNYYASIPAHYAELYKGDAFLFKHFATEDFDYSFNIKERHIIPNSLHTSGLTFSSIYNKGILSEGLLKILLLLPFCALLIALFKNIIGLKTFGTFLPALIAIALASTGIWFGIIAIISVLLIISIVNLVLEKWGMLQTPKLVIMLLTVIIVLLGLLSLGIQMDWLSTNQSFYIPIVILAILAERFAQKTIEEDWQKAFGILGQTLLVTLACYNLYSSDILLGIMICFPEIFLLLFAITLLLGNWIGLRVSEYRRFQWIVQ